MGTGASVAKVAEGLPEAPPLEREEYVKEHHKFFENYTEQKWNEIYPHVSSQSSAGALAALGEANYQNCIRIGVGAIAHTQDSEEVSPTPTAGIPQMQNTKKAEASEAFWKMACPDFAEAPPESQAEQLLDLIDGESKSWGNLVLRDAGDLLALWYALQWRFSGKTPKFVGKVAILLIKNSHLKAVVDDEKTTLDAGITTWDENVLKNETVPEIMRDWRLYSEAMCFLTDGQVGFEPMVVECCWDFVAKAHRPFWDSKYKRCISQSDVYNQEICDMVTEWEEKYKEANGGDSDVIAFHLLFPAGKPKTEIPITVGGIATNTIGHRHFKGRPAYMDEGLSWTHHHRVFWMFHETHHLYEGQFKDRFDFAELIQNLGCRTQIQPGYSTVCEFIDSQLKPMAFQKLGEPNYRNVVIWAVQGLCETGQPLEKAMEALEKGMDVLELPDENVGELIHETSIKEKPKKPPKKKTAAISIIDDHHQMWDAFQQKDQRMLRDHVSSTHLATAPHHQDWQEVLEHVETQVTAAARARLGDANFRNCYHMSFAAIGNAVALVTEGMALTGWPLSTFADLLNAHPKTLVFFRLLHRGLCHDFISEHHVLWDAHVKEDWEKVCGLIESQLRPMSYTRLGENNYRNVVTLAVRGLVNTGKPTADVVNVLKKGLGVLGYAEERAQETWLRASDGRSYNQFKATERPSYLLGPAYILVRPNGHWVTVDLTTAILTLVVGGIVAAVARGPAVVEAGASTATLARSWSTASTVASVSELSQATQVVANAAKGASSVSQAVVAIRAAAATMAAGAAGAAAGVAHLSEHIVAEHAEKQVMAEFVKQLDVAVAKHPNMCFKLAPGDERSVWWPDFFSHPANPLAWLSPSTWGRMITDAAKTVVVETILVDPSEEIIVAVAEHCENPAHGFSISNHGLEVVRGDGTRRPFREWRQLCEGVDLLGHQRHRTPTDSGGAFHLVPQEAPTSLPGRSAGLGVIAAPFNRRPHNGGQIVGAFGAKRWPSVPALEAKARSMVTRRRVRIGKTRSALQGPEGGSGGFEEDAARPGGSAAAPEALERYGGRSEAEAKLDDEYLSPFFTGIEKMSRVGGTGTVLYFQTLRTMGYLFATMAAITFPTTAFCLLGTFAPDNGQILARTSIGNLGLYVDTKILDPLLRIVRVSCDGMQLSDLTAIFAWLDLIAVFMLFCYLLRFRSLTALLFESEAAAFPSQASSLSDREKLPKRIDDQKNYEKELRLGKKKPQPEVREITLVRDFNGRLDALQEQARLTQQISVQQAYEKEKKVAKLQEKKAKLDQKIEMQMPEESDLPVLRAFVILNRVEDVHSLLYDYRLARFGLFRCCFPCLSRKRCFHGHAIRVREAPAPTDLLWENADTPWISRLLRPPNGHPPKCNRSGYIGHPLCDPIIPSNSSGEEEKYICFVNVAANWTKDYAVGQGGDILNCWCESQGYAKLAEDPSLINTCSNWLLELGKSIGTSEHRTDAPVSRRRSVV
eukprot:g9203.t1